jgi:NodT family efflux transporter outer membrane factor (OMF) lipoprotein
MGDMKRLSTLLPLTMALVLAGCVNLAPKYERPAAPVAGSFPTVAGTVASGNPVANEAPASIAWQRFFADARLQQLIQMALANNRDLRVSILNIEQARAAFQIQRAARFPAVNAGLTANRQGTPGDAPLTSVYQAGLSVTAFELDLFGRVRNLSDAALAQYLATEEARKSAQISLIATVANTYLALLADDELLALTQQTLKTREESLRLSKLRFENGVISKLDLQQAVSLVEQARTVLAQQQRLRAQDANALTLLVGQTIPDTLPAGGTLATTSLPDLPAGLPSDLLVSRPDIRAAEQQLIAANADIGAARANYFPRISLTGSAGSASAELSGLFKSGSYGWTFAPAAILPLFDFGARRAGVESARAAPMLALAAISCCSAERMSGRTASRSDGIPAGRSGRFVVASVAPAGRLSGIVWPISRVSRFRSCARWRWAWASVVRACSTSDTACSRSSLDETPFSKRRFVRRSDSSRVFRVCCVRDSNSSSARNVRYVLATCAIRLICAVLRASSVARNCASAASDRFFTRLKKSSSNAETDRPAW